MTGDAPPEEFIVCYACVDDDFLQAELREEGRRAACHYCQQTRESVTLEQLAERIHDVLQEHFFLTPSEPETSLELLSAKEGHWYRSGDDVDAVIAEIAGLRPPIAEDVRLHLSDRYGYGAVMDGEEDPYAETACYDQLRPDDSAFQESWRVFQLDIRSRARFFNENAKTILDELFADISALRTWEGASPVRDLAPTDSGVKLYRTRVASNQMELQRILADPARELGPPPSQKASAGRMNAAGVPVFYGALEEATCIVEARAPVGSHVVLGRFAVIRPLRVLDFGVLMDAYVKGSHFDPVYKTRCEQAFFLRRLVEELSQPVMPGEEAFEYLPTQVVAEYLGAYAEPRLDGLVFRSSQIAKEGRNIVLFNHACGVEPYELPEGTKIDFSMGWATEDDHDNSITIFEEVPSAADEEPRDASDKPTFPPFEDFLDPEAFKEEMLDDPRSTSDPALRLDTDGVRVLRIRGVSYDCEERYTRRHRTTPGEDEDF